MLADGAHLGDSLADVAPGRTSDRNEPRNVSIVAADDDLLTSTHAIDQLRKPVLCHGKGEWKNGAWRREKLIQTQASLCQASASREAEIAAARGSSSYFSNLRPAHPLGEDSRIKLRRTVGVQSRGMCAASTVIMLSAQ